MSTIRAQSDSSAGDSSLSTSPSSDSVVCADSDPFENLPRRCLVDIAYSVGPLTTESTSLQDAGSDVTAGYSIESLFDATIRWRNNKAESDNSFQVTYVFAYGQGIADGRVDERAVLINPGGANGMPARAVNRMLFRGVAGNGGTYDFGFKGSAISEISAAESDYANNYTMAENLVALAYNGEWCERVTNATNTCSETTYSWCCGAMLLPPPSPPLITPIGGNSSSSLADDDDDDDQDNNVTALSGPMQGPDTLYVDRLYDESFKNIGNVSSSLSPLAIALDRGARNPGSSKLPNNMGTFGSIFALVCVGLILVAIIFEMLRRFAKDLKKRAPGISRKLTNLLPGQGHLSIDVDLEGITISKHYLHPTQTADCENETETITHTLRRPQSKHKSIFENDGTQTFEFIYVNDGSSEALKYASLQTQGTGSVHSLALMFDGFSSSSHYNNDDDNTNINNTNKKELIMKKNESKITLDDVKLGHAIGRGAYGIVCRATYKGFPVAVKTLHGGKASLSKKEQRAFAKEISLLSRLSHENIVTFYGACNDKEQQLCIVMELMRVSLFQVLHEQNKNRGLTRFEFLRVINDVACGCKYLHELKIIHGDLKSHNVLLNGERAKICDVGCARVAQITGMLTTQQSIVLLQRTSNPESEKNNNNVVGTPAYMGPELFDNATEITQYIDVFALAVLMWECLSGETPWSHIQHPVQIAYAVAANDERLDISKVGDWEEAKTLIRKCWKRVPSQRLDMKSIIDCLREMKTRVA